MKDVLASKDYRGSVHLHADDEVFFGKIERIVDLVPFQGDSVIELEKAFEEAVNDYLKICKENGKETDKSQEGSFNVRIAPDIHKKATRLALMKGMSLNQFIQKAVEKEIIRESSNV